MHTPERVVVQLLELAGLEHHVLELVTRVLGEIVGHLPLLVAEVVGGARLGRLVAAQSTLPIPGLVVLLGPIPLVARLDHRASRMVRAVIEFAPRTFDHDYPPLLILCIAGALTQATAGIPPKKLNFK